MSFKETALIGATVVGLAVGVNQLLAPSTPEESRQNQQQQQVENLSDADENNKQRMRDEGNDHVDAENDQKVRSGERRPPEPYRPKIRIRLS
ncbi:hypothetical protein [Nocardioides daphniae]|uniref:Uncharacterized protein n=1 Tax=Nocardioides daphniae TaxID=402297 RepID=A0A4P7UBC2_9ACTN|nr:hypothetical protein [Nocardioides daphniae]QCC77400.1 hypothetical protein E2C04_09790 [Nocardioides daphniae]GGD24602.1 hypothetical protein GCM10007231_24730 [Nocardioides daphniae]